MSDSAKRTTTDLQDLLDQVNCLSSDVNGLHNSSNTGSIKRLVLRTIQTRLDLCEKLAARLLHNEEEEKGKGS